MWVSGAGQNFLSRATIETLADSDGRKLRGHGPGLFDWVES